jgi:hypothetical protein
MSNDDTIHIDVSRGGNCIMAYDKSISLSVFLSAFINRPLSELLDAFFGTGDELEAALRSEREITAGMEADELMDEWEDDPFEQDSYGRRDPRLSENVVEGEFVERE